MKIYLLVAASLLTHYALCSTAQSERLIKDAQKGDYAAECELGSRFLCGQNDGNPLHPIDLSTLIYVSDITVTASPSGVIVAIVVQSLSSKGISIDDAALFAICLRVSRFDENTKKWVAIMQFEDDVVPLFNMEPGETKITNNPTSISFFYADATIPSLQAGKHLLQLSSFYGQNNYMIGRVLGSVLFESGSRN